VTIRVSDYNLPDENRYSKDDEWVRADGNHFVVGITDFAQQQLGDVVFIELPEVGSHFEANQTFGVIESVKAVSDLYCPIAGEIVDVNGDLEDAPESVNEDCYGAGWLIRIAPADASASKDLMDASAYRAHVDGRSED
jgi:glycine cleavage system H protein